MDTQATRELHPPLPVDDAAAFLGISSHTLNNWRVQGCGPTFLKIGGRVSYDRDDLRQWRNEQRRSSTSEQVAA